jgi:hypothetical protein
MAAFDPGDGGLVEADNVRKHLLAQEGILPQIAEAFGDFSTQGWAFVCCHGDRITPRQPQQDSCSPVLLVLHCLLSGASLISAGGTPPLALPQPLARQRLRYRATGVSMLSSVDTTNLCGRGYPAPAQAFNSAGPLPDRRTGVSRDTATLIPPSDTSLISRGYPAARLSRSLCDSAHPRTYA